MKKYLLSFIFIFSLVPAFARHITGGEVIYDYLGPGAAPNTKRYKITLRLFRDNLTVNGALMPPAVRLGIFAGSTQFGPFHDIDLISNTPVGVISSPSCLSNTPFFDYSMGLYSLEIDLPNNPGGYIITYQTCCRVQDIDNVGNFNGELVGAAYTGSIPGTNSLTPGFIDNSARFQTGISIICNQNRFILDFSATDPDGDELQYSFGNAYDGGSIINAGLNNNPASPPYGSIPYVVPYSGFSPLGSSATLNSSTGIISGIAPPSGKYVVCVIVKSFKNGQIVATHRKDFIVTVAPCDFASSELNPVYTQCDVLDGFNVTFQNLNNSVLNLTFDWDFGDPGSGALNTSTDEIPTHTYSAAGDFILTLIVNRNTPCADTATAIVRVYPGFFPELAPVPSQCKNTPIQFNDLTTTIYGTVNSWRWDFGDPLTNADTSTIANPVYSYSAAGTYLVELIVGTTKGCQAALSRMVTITDKPNLIITNDTLICTIDTLQLRSNFTTGTIRWRPNYMISDTTSFNPNVSPDVTTTYTATYSDNFGCSVTKSVKVSVVNEVTLLAANDTTICRTDSARLRLNTDALYFAWTPANLILDPTVRNPIVFPTAAVTDFNVRASISNKCFKDETIRVTTVPYPVPMITGDAQVCFGKNAQLNATGGSIYLWSPPTFLNSTTIPNPIAIAPIRTATYTVSVRDTLGCPKAVSKDFTVNVIRIVADAGPSDTSVVLDQPLQLNATGSTNYQWIPPTYLNNPNIASPISNPRNNITYTVIVSNDIGCTARDTINVKVFFLPPDIYVPSAFTPGGDGLNELFRPIALGIRSLESFSVYNRWGQMVYTTSRIGDGWNGKFKGVPQESATYVWQANATDFKGRKIFRKGSVILIR